MNAGFDAYRESYEHVVDDSIDFLGLSHDFFLKAKVDLLQPLFHAHFGADCRPRVLDVGCGVGRLHPLLMPVVGTLAGTDVSTESLARAETENPSVDSSGRSSEAPSPGREEASTAHWWFWVLDHVDIAEREPLVREMRCVTRAGGLVVVIEHNPWNPLTRLAVARCPFDDDAVLLGARKARRLLQGCGLRNVKSRHFLVFPPQTIPSAGT